MMPVFVAAVVLHGGSRMQAAEPPAKVLTGIEVLRNRDFDVLQGKRVGLITNQTGVDSDLRSTIDILAGAHGVRLVALFAPEHGVRGTIPAGASVAPAIDPRTKLPVFSLYGATRKPTPSMLHNVDILVYDVQDIGLRSFTFIATLGLCMEAAAGRGIPLVVLDRPDPLGGRRIEGTPVHDGFFSFVSPYPIPYIYGLTPGELATYVNASGLLHGGVQCSLIVVPMQGWKRSMLYRETGLPWVPPSPHMPGPDDPMYCAALGATGELGTVSEGVGYTLPFHLFGASWIEADQLAAALNAHPIPGVMVRPVGYRPFYGRDAGKDLGGVQIYIRNPDTARLTSIQFRIMEVCHALFPTHDAFATDSTHLRMFDRVMGTDSIRIAFARHWRYEEIEGLMKDGEQVFRKTRKTCLLYPE